MENTKSARSQHTGEFIILMAILMSMVAMAIDAILPAFTAIGASYNVTDISELQWLIGALFLGLALGQLFFGPLSDSIGRKPGIYAGICVYISGALLSAFAPSYDMMLLGRLLQGFGVAAPRTITIALVRDQYGGREMARIMSFVISVFVLMPAVAPALGALMLMYSTWESIFFMFVAQALVATLWMAWRQPETLPASKRRPFSLMPVLQGAKEALCHRRSAGYMAVAGLAFACLISYLNVAKLMYLDIYAIDELFPAYFAVLALAIGAASLVNGKLVIKYGMRSLMQVSLGFMIATSGLFLLFILNNEGHPPFVLFFAVMIIVFFFMGILFGNANALAMEPMGHIAGVASSVIGSGTTLISMSVGTLIGHFYDQTLLPMFAGFTGLSIAGFLLMLWIERKE
ncbi:MAG: multidrug effflux MFS transporter [Methylocystaceae bacterium]|nr:multidrug effflux MFS transporter [Methylocystaceae bacterium]